MTLQEQLPPITQGKQSYPFRLALHGPYHTPLAAGVTAKAAGFLRELEFRQPNVTLIDGFGRRFTPWSTDIVALRDYTFGAQVSQPYDFTRSVTVVLREYAPDQLVLPGPGNTLGGICGQILVQLGWQGISSRADFTARQESDRPIVESMRR